MAKKVARGLSRTSQILLDAFDEAAQSHGWQLDWGIGKAVDKAAAEHKRTKAELTARIRYLEIQLSRHRSRCKELAPPIAVGIKE